MFPDTVRFGNRPPLICMYAPAAHKSLLGRKVVSVFTRSVIYLESTVVRGHPLVWSLALCPDNAKQDPVVYGAEFGVVFLSESPRTASLQ